MRGNWFRSHLVRERGECGSRSVPLTRHSIGICLGRAGRRIDEEDATKLAASSHTTEISEWAIREPQKISQSLTLPYRYVTGTDHTVARPAMPKRCIPCLTKPDPTSPDHNHKGVLLTISKHAAPYITSPRPSSPSRTIPQGENKNLTIGERTVPCGTSPCPAVPIRTLPFHRRTYPYHKLPRHATPHLTQTDLCRHRHSIPEFYL